MFETISRMKTEGVFLMNENGVLKIDGGKSTVDKWIPFIRENKTKILACLRTAAGSNSDTQTLADSKENAPRALNEQTDVAGQTEPAPEEIVPIIEALGKAVDAGRVQDQTAAALMTSLMDAEAVKDWPTFRALLERAKVLTF